MNKYQIFITSFIVFLLLCTHAFAAMPKILVINSYHAQYPWVESHNAALKNELKGTATLTFFYMDTKRLPAKRHPAMADLAMQAYGQQNPDIVILTDDNALRMLGERITNAGTPVIYLGINENPRRYFSGTIRATGILERPLLKRSIVFIKELFRGRMDKCLVLFDSGTTSFAIFSNVFGGEPSLRFAHTKVNVQLIPTFYQWKNHVLTAKEQGYEAIIIGLYQTLVDKDGKHVSDQEVARWTSANSPVPLFGFWDFAIGKGKAIGGLVLAGEPQGREAAKLVQKVLDGVSPMAITPITAEHGRFIFSKSEMKRWNITLPAEFVHPNEELLFVE